MSRFEIIIKFLRGILVVLIPVNIALLGFGLGNTARTVYLYEDLLCIENKIDGQITKECESTISDFMFDSIVNASYVMVCGTGLASGVMILMDWLKIDTMKYGELKKTRG